MGGDHLKRGCIIGVNIGPGKPIGAAAKAGCIAPGGRAPIMPAKQRRGRLVWSVIESRGRGQKNNTLPTCGIHVLLITRARRTRRRSWDPVNRIFLSFSHSLLIRNRNPQVYLRRDCSRYKVIMGPACCAVLIFLNVFLFRYYVIYHARFWRITRPSAQNKSQNCRGTSNWNFKRISMNQEM